MCCHGHLSCDSSRLTAGSGASPFIKTEGKK